MTTVTFTVPGEPRGSLREESVAARRARGVNTGCMEPKRPAIHRLLAQCALVDGCLVWTGSRSLKGGYGRFRDDAGRKVSTHRFAYEYFYGPIAPGMTIDHLCRNTACCAPTHLEAVSAAENIRRGTQGRWQAAKTHCPNGHPYEGDNLYVNPKGERACRTCQRANGRRHLKRLRERLGECAR